MFLGIDLGTSGLRALLVDGDGRPIGSAERHYSVSNPHPGWSEQDPADWIAALEGAMGELAAGHPEFADLGGMAVAGHMHGATLLDDRDEVIRPCILWNDTRSGKEAAELDAADGVRRRSGNIVFPGFTAPKLMWVRQHESDNFARVAKVLLPAAYLNLYLTGDHVADMSDSAGTSWLDVGARDWSPELLAAGGMSIDQMPRLAEGASPAGRLRPDLARKWGLSGSVVVAGGAGDNAAAACGTGAMTEGQGFVSLGTSGVVLVARDGFAPDPASAVHTFCHAVPGQWYQMSVMLAATDSLNWLSRITGQPAGALTAAAGSEVLAPGRTLFLPYLAGERTPHNDTEIRGAFTGIGVETDTPALTRAVMEGVSFGLRDGLEALRSTGADPQQLLAIGGGTGSEYWLRLLATILGLPLQVPKGGEFGAALGAARLAICAATGKEPGAVMGPPEIDRLVEPEISLQSAFEDAYRNFRAAYPNIRNIR